MLHVRFEEERGALVVTPLVRRLDAEVAPQLRASVVEAARGRALVVLSLLHVRAVDASGLAAIVSILQSLPPGGALRLAHVHPRVAGVLALTHLDEVIPSFADAWSALPA